MVGGERGGGVGGLGNGFGLWSRGHAAGLGWGVVVWWNDDERDGVEVLSVNKSEVEGGKGGSISDGGAALLQ